MAHCTITGLSAHASQAFSAYTPARDCTDSEHLPNVRIIKQLIEIIVTATSMASERPFFKGGTTDSK